MKRQETIARNEDAVKQLTASNPGSENQAIKTAKPILLTEDAYANLAEDYGGFCVECGDEAYGVEPDARRYRCESCGARAVFGAEELLIRGVIQFIEGELEE